MNILRSWGRQTQYSGLCDVAFYGLFLRLYPNACKDDASLFSESSSEMPLHGTLKPCYCVSTEYQQHIRKGCSGLCCWSVRSRLQQRLLYEGMRLTFSDVWMKMFIYSTHLQGLPSRMAQFLRKCCCHIAPTSSSRWGVTDWKVGLWLKVRLLFLYPFSEKLTVTEQDTSRRCLITVSKLWVDPEQPVVAELLTWIVVRHHVQWV